MKSPVTSVRVFDVAAAVREGERLTRLPARLVYASTRFGRFLERVCGGEIHYVVALRDREAIGLLPYAVRRAADGRVVVNSLPWYGSHGGCWLAEGADHAVRRALLETYRTQLECLQPLFTTTILSPFEQRYVAEYEAVLEVSARDVRVGQLSELPMESPDIDARLLAMAKPKTRNLIRKALNQGFVECLDDDDRAWAFLETTHRHNIAALGGTPKPADHFVALREIFGGDGLRLSIALLNGTPVAALLVLLHQRSAEYLVPVVDAAHRTRQPLSFLIWHALRAMARRGVRIWNWGGTWLEQASLHHFKAGWGAVDHPYTYLVHASPAGYRALADGLDRVLADFPYFFIFPRTQAAVSAAHSAGTGETG